MRHTTDRNLSLRETASGVHGASREVYERFYLDNNGSERADHPVQHASDPRSFAERMVSTTCIHKSCFFLLACLRLPHTCSASQTRPSRDPTYLSLSLSLLTPCDFARHAPKMSSARYKGTYENAAKPPPSRPCGLLYRFTLRSPRVVCCCAAPSPCDSGARYGLGVFCDCRSVSGPRTAYVAAVMSCDHDDPCSRPTPKFQVSWFCVESTQKLYRSIVLLRC